MAAACSAQTPPNLRAERGIIRGTVKTGTLPLHGVRVTASNDLTGKQITTTTDANGAYSLAVLPNGHYSVRAEFFGYESSSASIVVDARNAQPRLDFSLLNGANNLGSLWQTPLLPAANISSVSMQPAVSSLGGSSGAQVPSFTGDPNFSGDSFTVSG
jgi:hypothetical protein